MVTFIVCQDVHAKRVGSLANAVIGCFHAAELGVAAIGASFAAARGLNEKHAIKQVDRLLSNSKFDPVEFTKRWVGCRLGKTERMTVAIRWTDFEAQEQAVLSVSLVSKKWTLFASLLKGVC